MPVCSICNKQSKPELLIAYHLRGLQEGYFKCKHCGKRYSSYFTDKKVRNLQKQLKKEQGGQKRLEIVEQIKSNMAQLKLKHG
ncbi:hypothetical protein GLV94_02980 [Virgibacillus halodenitrificans]|uniref:hypothetical protein n=1 Tax=Virgibacillus halodenitrificans TaxID=1482 RepID=UPI001370BD76|nr:hypothetical protein [Virgibacillus halodenitrificans]MYL44597.1 hypothetical protein [Virgibacillus halodenitrificans]